MFKFKQFTVHQENSAMKVCTDSCLFGALIRSQTGEKALDIGAGTGLLSLMVAQRYPKLEIDAVESAAGSAGDARANFRQSPFHERLNLYEGRIQDFTTPLFYDLIFSNPPFYQNQLKSPDPGRNLAHHAADLSFQELAVTAAGLLKKTGTFWILLPPQSMQSFTAEAANHSLHKCEHFIVRQRFDGPVFREVAVFSFAITEKPLIHEIFLYENDKYSRIFAELLRDYYLIF